MDLEIARETLRRIEMDNIQRGHWLLMGLTKEVERIMEKEGPEKSFGLLFRLTRKKGLHNPYQEQLKLSKYDCKAIEQKALNNGIILSGGIGDHIEQVCQINEYLRAKEKTLRMGTSKTRYQQLVRALKAIDIDLIIMKDKDNAVPIEIIMATLGNNLPKAEPIFVEKNAKETDEGGMICCWNVEAKGDIYSKWCRSITFREVYRFYKDLRDMGYKMQRITDISRWKTWEEYILKGLGIEIVDPTSSDIYDLMKVIKSKRCAISVDTALTHLCAAMGKKVYVMLPLYPDERWYKFRKSDNMYSRNCIFLQQKDYGKWQKEIEKLGSMVISELENI